MSREKESETIKQQKLARKEFLELKKMQSGEIETGPKPSEVAIVPKTFGEKLSNIWYHFGKVIIVTAFLLVAIIIMVVQCANKTSYDLEVIYFTYTALPDTTTEKMADYFEKYATDVNGNGKVDVAVINCSCNPNSNNNAKLTKMQALIVSDSSALLYITDDKSVKYFYNIRSDSKGFFDENSVVLSEDFYKTITEEGYNLPENLTLRIRNTEGTQIEKDKALTANTLAAKELMEKISKK